MLETSQLQETNPNFLRLKSELINHADGPQLYEDPIFTTKFSALFHKDTSQEFQPSDLCWYRPGYLCKNPTLLSDSDSVLRVTPGFLTPPWFPTLLRILKERELLELVVPNFYFQNTFSRKVSVLAPSQICYCGVFLFTFRRGGILENVVIDDRLPCTENRVQLTSASTNSEEFLPALLEKAYAKYVGGYYNLQKQSFLAALMDFTGGLVEIISMKEDDKFTESEIKNVDNKLGNLVGDSFVICLLDTFEPVKSNGMTTDVEACKACIITATSKFPRSPPEDIKEFVSSDEIPEISAVRITYLANQNFESDRILGKSIDKKWNDSSYAVRKWYGVMWDRESDQWISTEELPLLSRQTVILHLLSRNSIMALARNQQLWKYIFYESYWARNGPRGNLASAGDSFLKNNQYLVKVDYDGGCNIKVVLTNVQKYIDAGANVIQQGFDAKLGITILEVERNRQFKVHDLNHTQIVQSPIDCRVDRTVIVSAFLPLGTYIIIPWISKGPGTKFTLQLFTSLNVETRVLELDVPDSIFCTTCQIKNTAIDTQKKLITLYERSVKDSFSSETKNDLNGQSELCEDCQSKYPKRATRVSVIEAETIEITKNYQLYNFYFKISCGNEFYMSKMVRNTLSPQWNENFIFYRGFPEESVISIEVYNEGKFGIVSVAGQYTFTERELREDEKYSVSLRIQNGSEYVNTKGRLIVEIQNYFPSEFNSI